MQLERIKRLRGYILKGKIFSEHDWALPYAIAPRPLASKKTFNSSPTYRFAPPIFYLLPSIFREKNSDFFLHRYIPAGEDAAVEVEGDGEGGLGVAVGDPVLAGGAVGVGQGVFA